MGTYDVNYYYISIYYLDGEAGIHKRTIFNLFDLLSVCGGVLELLVYLFGLFLNPIATHDFIMKVANILYIGRTKDKGIF